jgi:hypothetical protein
MRSKWSRIAVGVALVAVSAVVFAQGAQAASVNGALSGASFGDVFGALAQDNAREYLYLDDGDGLIGVGDVLRGILRIDEADISPLNLGGTNNVSFTPTSGNNEWAAVFQVMVTSRGAITGDGSVGDPFRADLTFGPDAGFTEAGALAGSAMVVFYEDTTHEFLADNGTGQSFTTEQLIARVTNGTQYWAMGFTGAGADVNGNTAAATGEGWSAPSSFLALAPGVPGAITLATFNAAMNRLFIGGGSLGDSVLLTKMLSPIFAPASGATVDFLAGGTVNGIGTSTPFEAQSNNVTFQFTGQVIPLPGAIWAGLGMLGMLGAARMRRRRRS